MAEEKAQEKKEPTRSAADIAAEEFNSVMADAAAALKSKGLNVVGGRTAHTVDGALYYITVRKGK